MQRSMTLVLLGTVAFGDAGFAQQRLDPARLHPITVPVRDAGVFDWQTKQWVTGPRASMQLSSRYTVFRNDCSSAGGGVFFSMPECWDVIDEGRLPGTNTPPGSLPGYTPSGIHIQSGVAVSGWTDDQIISSAQFAYCTTVLTGTVDIKIGFYQDLGGDCANGVPVKGKPYNLTLPQQAVPFGNTTAYFDFGVAAGFPLPGSSVAGQVTCWTMTIDFPNNAGFCMQSEGNGQWANSAGGDKFSWSFEHDNPSPTFGGSQGPILAGDPSLGGYGAGSYNIPASFGCGTGNDVFDGWWLNIDGSSTAGAPGNCGVPISTGCYWFGGWPGNPIGNFWMVMDSTGSCSGCANRPTAYCTAGTTSSGCQALISAVGTSSATLSSGFFVRAADVEGGGAGLFVYGINGPKAGGATPWGASSSFQCVAPPLAITRPQPGVGSSGQCNGFFSIDMNARFAANPNHNPGAGGQIDGQYLFRDPAGPVPGTALSDAISWTICP